MNTSFESVRAKIVALEEELARLRIAEYELLELDGKAGRKPRGTGKPANMREAVRSDPDGEAKRQTIGATITEVLAQHGEISAREINRQIEAMGRDINGRAISFTLQTMKKNGLVKNLSGSWKLTAKGAKRA